MIGVIALEEVVQSMSEITRQLFFLRVLEAPLLPANVMSNCQAGKGFLQGAAFDLSSVPNT